MSQIMISASSIDVQALGVSQKPSKSQKLTHLFTLKINGKKVLESAKVPGESLAWKEVKKFHFTPSANIDIFILRKSRIFGWRKPVRVAEYNGRGMDFLDTTQELVENSGTSRLAIKFSLVAESHEDFMKAVDEEMLQLGKVKGADTAQTATSLVATIGTALEAIVPVLDNLASAHPVINGAWIVLSSAYKLAHQIAQNQIAQDAVALDLVESLREMAGAARSYKEPREIPGTINIMEEIGKASLEAARLVHDYVDPSIQGNAKFLARVVAHTLSDMPSRIAASEKRCQELTKKLGLRIALDTNSIALDTNARLKQVQHGLNKREVQQWIYLVDSDTSPNQNAAQEAHLAGTGSWFLGGEEFARWKAQPGSVLWLEGGQGSGKTILSSSAIKAIIDFCHSKPLDRGYAYFYFDARNEKDKLHHLAHQNFIRSLISQLSDMCGDELPTALVELYNACDKGHRQPDRTSLENALLGVLECFEDVYIVIDSLDECAKQDDLLKWMQYVSSQPARQPHIMATSRPEEKIKQGLAPIATLRRVKIVHGSTSNDIIDYVGAEVGKMDKWNDVEKKMIKDAILPRSDGMFRWVAMQIHDVKKCLTTYDLEVQLSSLPRGLDEAYARIFERSERPKDLIKLLQWLAFSKREMLVDEIAEATAVDLGRAEGPLYDPRMRYKEPADILTICDGLVARVDGTFKLAHFSVKEYLIKHLRFTAETQRCTSEQLSNSVIAQTCLAHLLYLDRESILDEEPSGYIFRHHLSLFPLAQYAAEKWVNHVHSAHANCPHLPKLLLKLFALPQNRALINWVRLRNLDFSSEEKCLPSPLYYACLDGWTEVAAHSITNGADVNIVEETYDTALQVACQGGHIEIAKLLLDNGADVNAVREGYDSALQVACQKGHVELAKLLLDNGADVDLNAGEDDSYTALQEACQRGDVEVAKFLLDNGADVNFAPAPADTYSSPGTALQEACLEGYIELAKVLLDNGADVNAEGGFYSGTALQAACRRGHIELATFLIDNGADINDAAEEYEYGTALIGASDGGHIEIAKLLLDKGADVNAPGGRFGTALQAADTQAHGELVKLLHTWGAIDSQVDLKYWSIDSQVDVTS